MALRRSTRVPKPKAIWEAETAPPTALCTKTSAKDPQTVQRVAIEPAALHPLPEIIESNDNALFDGEQDLRAPAVPWKGKGVPSAALDLKIIKRNQPHFRYHNSLNYPRNGCCQTHL